MKISNKLKVMLKNILSISMGEVKTDKATLIYDGEGEIAVGIEVFIKDENDEVVAAPDGEYTAEDKKIIKVVEGKVAEIVEPEEPATEEPEELVKFRQTAVEMSASYDEIYQNIYAAIRETGIVDFYIMEAGEDFAVVSIWNGEKDTYFRYALTTNEDGSIVLGERVEVESAFVPVEKKTEETPAEPTTEEPETPVAMAEELLEPAADPATEEPEVEPTIEERIAAVEELANTIKDSLDAILNGIAALENRVSDVEEKLVKVESEPAASPIEEPVIEEKEIKSKLSYLRKN